MQISGQKTEKEFYKYIGLSGEVIVPEQVLRELQALSDFGMDVSWLPATPWLKVKRAASNALLSKLT